MTRPHAKLEPAIDPRPALWAGLACLLLLSVLFQLVPWDRDLASLYWNQGRDPWPGRESFFFSLLYRWGYLPAQAAGMLGLLGFLLSYKRPSFRRWRGPGLFLFLLLLLGPGVVVNVLGKALTGRPRPSQTLGFGGTWEFLRPWHFGVPGRGDSFPSGHASMGYFWVCLFFLWSRRTRWMGLALGLVAGLWMSAARIAQGGHYLSDTLFSGVAVFLVAAALSPLIRWQPKPAFWGQRKVLAALGLTALGFLMLSNVVYEERRFIWAAPPAPAAPLATERVQAWAGDQPLDRVALDLAVERGDVQVYFTARGDNGLLPLRIDERFQGQGLPGAKDRLEAVPLGADPLFIQGPGTLGAKLLQTLRGAWWTTRGSYDVALPQNLGVDARLKTAHGVLTIGPFPLGRQVLVNGSVAQESLPPGFKPFGDRGWLLEGAQPQIALTLDAPDIHFDR